MKKRTYIWLVIGFFVLLLVVGLAALVISELARPSVSVPARAYLDVNLSGPVEEVAPPDFIYAYFFNYKPLSLHDLYENLRKAGADPRIRSVLLRLNLLGCDWAKVEEMRAAISGFRATGKKVYAYIDEAPDFDKEYYLATACDRIILHPLGWLGVNGLSGYFPFLKTALDKLGVRAEFEHVEEYKTAANMFTEKGFTPAHREETEAIYKDIFAAYVRGAAEARHLSEAEFRRLIDRGFFQGDEAKQAGLVDDCLYEDELQTLMAGGGQTLKRMKFDDYTRVRPESLGLETGPKVALVYATGTIMTGESLPQVLGSSTLSRWLKNARGDASIKAVVLRIDSPGGSSVGSDIIWREVELTRRVKPVIVSMSDLAGSGGYWIAMPATKIVARPQTLTGSIGVLAGKFSLKGLMDKLGITTETLSFGEKADIFSPFKPFTEAEKKALKEQILWIYDRFVEKAAEGRHLSKEEVDRVGRGRVWTGRQAAEIGLVDGLGGLKEALELAKKEAGIPSGEDVRLEVWPKRQTLWQMLTSRRQTIIRSPASAPFRTALETLRAMDRTRTWAIMPFFWSPELSPSVQ